MKNLSELIESISQKKIILGPHDKFGIENVTTLEKATQRSLIWLSSKNSYQIRELKTNAVAIVCSLDAPVTDEMIDRADKVFIKVEDPKSAIIEVINEHFLVPSPSPQVHPSAIIHPDAVIGEGVDIGPYTVIGKCKVGNNSKVFAHCYIFDHVQIGQDVVIGPGCKIGGDGFGYVRSENGKPQKFPHLGSVIIDDEVEIGCNSCIDRGTLGDTHIHKGAKIDNLVHIAHNVVIEEGAFIIANSTICGSTTVGKNTWIAPNSVLKNGIMVEEGACIGLGSVVLKNVPKGEVWVGNPATNLIKQ